MEARSELLNRDLERLLFARLLVADHAVVAAVGPRDTGHPEEVAGLVSDPKVGGQFLASHRHDDALIALAVSILTAR